MGSGLVSARSSRQVPEPRPESSNALSEDKLIRQGCHPPGRKEPAIGAVRRSVASRLGPSPSSLPERRAKPEPVQLGSRDPHDVSRLLVPAAHERPAFREPDSVRSTAQRRAGTRQDRRRAAAPVSVGALCRSSLELAAATGRQKPSRRALLRPARRAPRPVSPVESTSACDSGGLRQARRPADSGRQPRIPDRCSRRRPGWRGSECGLRRMSSRCRRPPPRH
jgi:hypothetical protein